MMECNELPSPKFNKNVQLSAEADEDEDEANGYF